MSANNTLLHTIKQQLDNFVLNNPENFIADLGMMAIYDQPLLAVASAEDELSGKAQRAGRGRPPALISGRMVARSQICSFLFPAIHGTDSFCQSVGGRARYGMALRTL